MKNPQKNLRAAPKDALIHFPLVGSAHQSFCALILPTERGYFRGKRESLKKEQRKAYLVRQSYSLKRILLFYLDSTEAEIH